MASQSLFLRAKLKVNGKRRQQKKVKKRKREKELKEERAKKGRRKVTKEEMNCG